jgi:hypothetical protein
MCRIGTLALATVLLLAAVGSQAAGETPIPYPFGSERTGYLVTDLDAAIAAARACGGGAGVRPSAAAAEWSVGAAQGTLGMIAENPSTRGTHGW